MNIEIYDYLEVDIEDGDDMEHFVYMRDQPEEMTFTLFKHEAIALVNTLHKVFENESEDRALRMQRRTDRDKLIAWNLNAQRTLS